MGEQPFFVECEQCITMCDWSNLQSSVFIQVHHSGPKGVVLGQTLC